LIIACDGLWDVVSNDKAVEIVEKYPDPTRAATALRDYAHLLGSLDNISVIVYRLDFDRRDTNITRQSSSTGSSGSSFIIVEPENNIHTCDY